MIVGSGLIYFELLEQEVGLMEGFQFWVNLLVRNKMQVLSYCDIFVIVILEFMMEQGVCVCVIVGFSYGMVGVVQCLDMELFYFDVYLLVGSCFVQLIVVGYNVFIYIYCGSVSIVGIEVGDWQMVIFVNDGVVICVEVVEVL